MLAPTMTTATTDTPNAYLANGLVGLTVPRSPLQTGQMRVNGCFGRKAENNTEWVALLPYPVGLELAVNDIPVIEHGGAFVSQTLDFANGELTTRNVYNTGGVRLETEALQICSRTHPSVTARRLRIRVSGPCRLRFRAYIDADQVPGNTALSDSPVQEADTILHWKTEGDLSSCGIALTTKVSRGTELRRRVLGRLSTILEVTPDEHGLVEITQTAAVVPQILHEEPHWQALRLLRASLWRGFDELVAENRAAWAEIWKGRIVLRGAGESWQRLADAAYFYLFASAHQVSPCSIPPFALSASGYGGHIFWDTETFMYPVFLLAAPEIARSLVRYRTERLPAARTNARINGYGGAMFPWESGLTGSEVTPIWADTSEEHHISLDVAFACLQYAHVSGDRVFVEREVWPLVAEVCAWILDRVVKTTRGYEIHHVVGVDEGMRNVNNNSYTNIAAKVVLREADALARALKITPPAAWRVVAEGIHVPLDPELGIIRKHDTYVYEGGPCVPETLAAFFPFTYRHPDLAVEERTYKYHLDLADTVLHFPMLSSLYGVWAARRGNRDLALHCFTKGIAEFACEPFLSFTEFRGADRPLFLTNPAGFLTACLHGLTGIQVDAGEPETWGKYPVILPTGWEAVEVERIWIRGRPAALSARHGEGVAKIRWLD